MSFKINSTNSGHRRFYKYFGFLAVTAVLAIVYSEWKITRAKKLTEQLCAAVPVGSPSDDVEGKAKKLGLQMSIGASTDEKKQPGEMTIMAWDGFVFGRYYCTINYADGKVIKSWVAFVD